MNWVFKHLFTKKIVNKSNNIPAEQGAAKVREKKEAALNEVGKRYGRAITRLSDT